MNDVSTLPTPAQIYDERFVPALFEAWGPVVAGAAAVSEGQHVLDVACGTGALTLAAVALAGDQGRVVGLDAEPEMLRVARCKSADIEWHHGLAENLPYSDASFDAVVSQFGFMFFDDRPAALSEMWRVLKPGGRLVVAVCGALERSPGYLAFAELLDQLFGKDVGDSFRAPFVLGDRNRLRQIAEDADLPDVCVAERMGVVRFETIADLVATERACVWTLGGLLDDAQFDRLLEEADQALRPFVSQDGRLAFDMPALILSAKKEHFVLNR